MAKYVIRRQFKMYIGYYYGPAHDLEENKIGSRWTLSIKFAKTFDNPESAERYAKVNNIPLSEDSNTEIIKAY